MGFKKIIHRMLAAAGLLFVAAEIASAQTTLTGHIQDTNGEPLPGAVVQVEGTSTYAVADMDGNYSIPVSDGQALKFSSVGFIGQTAVFRSQKAINITLETEVTALDEVVVVGYGSIKKKEMTSAVSHISAKDLSQVSTLDTKMLLQGKVWVKITVFFVVSKLCFHCKYPSFRFLIGINYQGYSHWRCAGVMPTSKSQHCASPNTKRNPNPSPIGKRFGFLLFGAGDRT